MHANERFVIYIVNHYDHLNGQHKMHNKLLANATINRLNGTTQLNGSHLYNQPFSLSNYETPTYAVCVCVSPLNLCSF